MTDHVFRQTLVRHMCDDIPTLDEITKVERKDREHLLNCVAVSKGFTDWVDAYHAVRSDARWTAVVFPSNNDRYDVVSGTAKVRSEGSAPPMSNPTPGPWEASGVHILKQEGSSDYWITTAATFDCGESEAKANARLIAAAPDMLAALKGCFILPRPWMDGCGWQEWNEAFEAIEAAIKKAEGRASEGL